MMEILPLDSDGVLFNAQFIFGGITIFAVLAVLAIWFLIPPVNVKVGPEKSIDHDLPKKRKLDSTERVKPSNKIQPHVTEKAFFQNNHQPVTHAKIQVSQQAQFQESQNIPSKNQQNSQSQGNNQQKSTDPTSHHAPPLVHSADKTVQSSPVSTKIIPEPQHQPKPEPQQQQTQQPGEEDPLLSIAATVGAARLKTPAELTFPIPVTASPPNSANSKKQQASEFEWLLQQSNAASQLAFDDSLSFEQLQRIQEHQLGSLHPPSLTQPPGFESPQKPQIHRPLYANSPHQDTPLRQPPLQSYSPISFDIDYQLHPSQPAGVPLAQQQPVAAQDTDQWSNKPYHSIRQRRNIFRNSSPYKPSSELMQFEGHESSSLLSATAGGPGSYLLHQIDDFSPASSPTRTGGAYNRFHSRGGGGGHYEEDASSTASMSTTTGIADGDDDRTDDAYSRIFSTVFEEHAATSTDNSSSSSHRPVSPQTSPRKPGVTVVTAVEAKKRSSPVSFLTKEDSKSAPAAACAETTAPISVSTTTATVSSPARKVYVSPRLPVKTQAPAPAPAAPQPQPQPLQQKAHRHQQLSTLKEDDRDSEDEGEGGALYTPMTKQSLHSNGSSHTRFGRETGGAARVSSAALYQQAQQTAQTSTTIVHEGAGGNSSDKPQQLFLPPSNKTFDLVAITTPINTSNPGQMFYYASPAAGGAGGPRNKKASTSATASTRYNGTSSTYRDRGETFQSNPRESRETYTTVRDSRDVGREGGREGVYITPHTRESRDPAYSSNAAVRDRESRDREPYNPAREALRIASEINSRVVRGGETTYSNPRDSYVHSRADSSREGYVSSRSQQYIAPAASGHMGGGYYGQEDYDQYYGRREGQSERRYNTSSSGREGSFNRYAEERY